MTKDQIKDMIGFHENALTILRKELEGKGRQMLRVIGKEDTTNTYDWNDNMPDIGGTLEVKHIFPDKVTALRKPGSKNIWTFKRSDVVLFIDEPEPDEPEMTVH